MPNRADWLLLALAEVDNGRMSPLQLQKTMFLMKMEAGEHVGQHFYNFVPYNYGPFDSTIYADTQAWISTGDIVAEDSGRNWQTYMITAAGLKRALEISEDVDQIAVDYLHRVANWVTGQSFASLLTSIYSKYPEYAENSVFRN